MSVVHRTYARALYDSARAKGRVAEVHAQLGEFVRAIQDVPELRAVLRNPQVDKRAKGAAVAALAEGGEEIVGNFLQLMAEKGRAGEIEQVVEELERLVARERGQITVELTTAYELTDSDASAILDQIEQASGRKVEATRKVDPSLIGGIVLQAGSFLVDASVRGRLERLRRDLVGGKA